MTDFHTSRKIGKTRKTHCCEQCGKIIDIGSPASKAVGVFDGYFYQNYTHVECNAAAWEFAKESDSWGEEFPFFQYDDRDIETDKWLIENHPIVAERLGIIE